MRWLPKTYWKSEEGILVICEDVQEEKPAEDKYRDAE